MPYSKEGGNVRKFNAGRLPGTARKDGITNLPTPETSARLALLVQKAPELITLLQTQSAISPNKEWRMVPLPAPQLQKLEHTYTRIRKGINETITLTLTENVGRLVLTIENRANAITQQITIRPEPGPLVLRSPHQVLPDDEIERIFERTLPATAQEHSLNLNLETNVSEEMRRDLSLLTVKLVNFLLRHRGEQRLAKDAIVLNQTREGLTVVANYSINGQTKPPYHLTYSYNKPSQVTILGKHTNEIVFLHLNGMHVSIRNIRSAIPLQVLHSLIQETTTLLNIPEGI